MMRKFIASLLIKLTKKVIGDDIETSPKQTEILKEQVNKKESKEAIELPQIIKEKEPKPKKIKG